MPVTRPARFLPALRASASGLAAVAALFAAACADAPTAASRTGDAGPVLARAATAAADEAVVPGEVLVKVRDGADAAEVVRTHGLALGRVGLRGAYRVALTARGNERALAAQLAADPRVEFAEPNYLRTVDADARLWAFTNPGGLNMTFSDPTDSRYGTPLPSTYASLNDADEDAIANIGAGGTAVIIGSIDTGVDFTHPEFTGRLIAGKDWVDNDNDPSDTPDEGHGTHTTGTMAGANVGVAGATGAASNVKVYVQRVCGPSGCPTSAIVNAIYAAADYNANNPGSAPLVAVNMSLGGTTESTAEKNAIQYATTKNVLVIASAGNSGTSKVACPACDPNAVSVASTTWRDELASYSQYGKGLEISAPGGNCYSNTTPEGCIFSAVVAGYTSGAVSGPIAGATYAYMQGTSMAAPQVTGAAAVVASKLGLRGTALRDRLLTTADDKGTPGYDTKFGYGRLNVYRAVTGNVLAAGQ